MIASNTSTTDVSTSMSSTQLMFSVSVNELTPSVDQMGYHKETSEQLIFQDGIILSTGTPEEFCWNDSDQQTTRFETAGDDDLERVIEKNSGERVFTYDACFIEFDFRCSAQIESASEVSFEYIFGSEEYYEVSELINSAAPIRSNICWMLLANSMCSLISTMRLDYFSMAITMAITSPFFPTA